MKHYLIPALVAGSMFALTSCSSEEEPVINGQDGTTTFTVQLPADLTRSFGDAPTNQQLNVVIYAKDETTPLFSSINGSTDPKGMIVTQFATNGGLEAKIEVSLVKGKSYDLILWSQDATDQPYSYKTDTQTLTVNYGTKEAPLGNYADDRDAFFAFKNITSGDPTTTGETIELKRMFAQVNVGTADLQKYKDAGGTDSFGIKLSGLATELNLKTGIVANPTGEVTATTTPAESNSMAFPTIENYTGSLDYLAMAYVLVGNGTLPNKSTINVVLNANGNQTFATYPSVPVQMNYRTNIYGDLLTNPEVFNVEINSIFEQPDILYWTGEVEVPKVVDNQIAISSPAQLAGLNELVKNPANKGLAGVTVTLPKNAEFDMRAAEWTPIGNMNGQIAFAGVFDGNGSTIKNLKVANIAPNGKVSAGLFGQVQGVNCVIKNITVENISLTSECYAGGIAAYSNGDGCTIENCHVKGGTITLNYTAPGKPGDAYDNCDKAGGIIGGFQGGPFVVRNCSVDGITISGYRGLGGIAGRLSITADAFTGNSVTNVTINQDMTHPYKNPIPTQLGIFIGDWSKIPTLDDYLHAGNTFENVTINGVLQQQ